MNIYQAVRDGAERPSARALISDGQSWTYGELLDHAERFAERVSGTPVVVAEVTDPFCTAIVTIGSDLAGVSVVHRDPATPGSFPGRVVHDARTRQPEDVPVVGDRLWLGPDVAIPADLPTAQIFLTSGSTGTPVGVVRTADAVLADGNRVADVLGYAPDAPVVNAAPMFHAYGYNYGLIGPLVRGATVHCCPSRTIPTQLARAVREIGARTLIALPFHYGLVAGAPDTVVTRLFEEFAGLRSAVSAGAPLADGVAAAVLERFAFTLYNCYGSSEAGAVTLTRLTGAEDTSNVGLPLPGVMARVQRLDDLSEVGELQLRTTSLAAGRLGPDGVVPLAGEDGWFATGDLAVAGSESTAIRLVGRVTNVINVAGKKVSPAEIEQVLIAHPHIADAQVVAADDPVRGQVPVARIVPRGTADVTELTRWCRDRLAPHQMPRDFELIAEIPRSATGKPLATTGGTT